MKVSVVMSVYQQGHLTALRAAIVSVLSQSFCDFEFIIYADGCKDDILSFLHDFERTDKRIRVLAGLRNHGLAYGLNQCLRSATGEFIMRMDADDWCEPLRLEHQLKALHEHPEAEWCSCNALLFDDHGIWGERVLKESPDTMDLRFKPPFIHAATLFRAGCLKTVGGYRDTRWTRRVEDIDLWFRLYAHGYRGINCADRDYWIREDHTAYRRRRYRYRINECWVKHQGFKQLHLYPKAFPYVIKPLIVGLIPQVILKRLRGESIRSL